MSNYKEEIKINDKLKSGYALIITGILSIVFMFVLFYIFLSIINHWFINLLYLILLIVGLILIRFGQTMLKNRYALIDNDSIRFFIPRFRGRMNTIEFKWANLERIEVHRSTIIEYSQNEIWLMYEQKTMRFPLYEFTKKALIEILNALKRFAEEKHIRFISEIKLDN